MVQSFLEITRKSTADGTCLGLKGWLDTANSPKLQTEVEDIMASPEKGDIILEISELLFISSAGLRILLMIENKCRADGRRQIIRGATQATKELFSLTGFAKILTIE
ncbi:MAG: STAS domain-containing protein [Oscillospiraceae bacterium]|nr:STAS domain-containing protein [Oscillospiraceae bacterium]